ncbi:MAG: CynX/NimT family MFS transporter [Acidimicrobiales bacterium]
MSAVRPLEMGTSRSVRRGTLGLALIVVAINLRIAIAAPAPVLDQIQASTGMSAAVSGLLTTVPVICFAVFALLTPRLIRRFGMTRLLRLTLVVLVGGMILRWAPSTAALFAGTAVIGATIAVANVLLPGLIKRDFPDRIGLITGLYSMALFLGASIAAGLTIPLQHATGMGWRPAMAVWAIPALGAIALWSPQLRRGDGPEPAGGAETGSARARDIWRDRVAWSVAGFMGLQSLAYYSALTWLPTIFKAHGMSAGEAGWMLSFTSFPAIAAALVTPVVARHLRHRATMVVIAVSLYAIGYLGLIVDPVPLAYLWTVALGFGQGAALSLALGYIVLRAPDTHHAAQLSTMVFSTGYLIAGTGPFVLGAIHDVTGTWTVPLLVLVGVAGAQLAAGMAASRPRYVLAAGRQAAS